MNPKNTGACARVAMISMWCFVFSCLHTEAAPQEPQTPKKTAQTEENAAQVPHEPDRPPSIGDVKKLRQDVDRRFERLNDHYERNIAVFQETFGSDARAWFRRTKAIYAETFESFPQNDNELEANAANAQRALLRLQNLLKVCEDFEGEALKAIRAPKITDPQKERDRVTEWLYRFEHGEPQKRKRGELEELKRFALDKSQHYDIQDGEELLGRIDDIIKSAKARASDPNPLTLLSGWHVEKRRIELFLNGAERLLKDAPLKTGVSQKGIRAEQDALDKLTGCFEFRMKGDMYRVCQARKGPPPLLKRSEAVMQSFEHEKINPGEVPRECQGERGAKIAFAPGVVEWKYCDNLGQHCTYYIFVEDFSGLYELMLKDQLTHDEIVQLFMQACHEFPSTNDFVLAYTGEHPIDANHALKTIWRDDHAPADAFGDAGLDRIKIALGPPLPFSVELLFDVAFKEVAEKIDHAITQLEELMDDLASSDPELFQTFNEKLDELSAGRSNYEAIALALTRMHKDMPAEHSRADFSKQLQMEFERIVELFDFRINQNIKALRMLQENRAAELAYRPGEKLYVFLWMSGTPLPKTHLTFSATQLLRQDNGAVYEQELGTLVRTYDDPTDPQRLVRTTIEGQRWWLTWFRTPIVIWDSDEHGIPFFTFGLTENQYLMTQLPADVRALVSILDETTGKTVEKELYFSIVP